MQLTLDKIITRLDDYLNYDWQAFNHFGMKEQCQEWKRLENGFKSMIQKEYVKGQFDFEKVYSLIRSYDDKFECLPIKGKIYVTVNKRLLGKQLIDVIKEMEYQEVKEIEKRHCECPILSRFKKNPEIESLKEIGVINDGYYMPKLHICNNCGFKWTSYISDDSIGATIYEEFNSEDDKLVEYYK